MNYSAWRSLCWGIASIFVGMLMIPQLIAIGNGHMGLVKARRGKNSRGIAIAGLVLGYGLLAVWLIIWLVMT